MLFAAIAMVSFTVSANAANEVVESVELVTASSTPCADQYVIDLAVLQGQYPGSQMNLDLETADKIAKELFNKCLDDTYSSGSKNNNTVTGPKSNGLTK